MPARAALRNPGSSSATTTRRATGTPVSASTTMIPDEPAEPVHFPHLRERIAEIFNDAQQSTAGHRKLVVRLRKIQTICCGLEQSERNVSQRDSARRQAGSLIDNVDIDSSQDSEEEFKTEVLRCVIRVLPVKKSESTGDRAVRFVGSFLSSATEKGTLYMLFLYIYRFFSDKKLYRLSKSRSSSRGNRRVSRNRNFSSHNHDRFNACTPNGRQG